MAVHTGIRRGELLNLRWDQTNFEQQIITITDTKNGERKDIPMDETVRNLLQGLERKTEFVFPSSEGKPSDPQVVHKAFHRALDLQGSQTFDFTI